MMRKTDDCVRVLVNMMISWQLPPLHLPAGSRDGVGHNKHVRDARKKQQKEFVKCFIDLDNATMRGCL